ncbi:hypothetical protein ROLI_019400 [Roseobacter fucihabitans]|uniref:DUF1499 domain-containing protein n=1 Tax=Roseobacter fucihabitans TaxID=1537242 RepID=A0ABZ2BSC0_9RHOB|nr:DUF1499 domain-containing protein [Roseobacter litoralis]MBC6966154.1 hypothetical protein [Roseobacter litoralis]
MVGGLLVVLVLAFAAYVRFAPLPVEQWHVPVTARADADRADGAARILQGGAQKFEGLNQAMANMARTRVLAGSLESGRITYVTRSAVFGFPDLTTIERVGDEIRLHARLRFGASDLGVNRKRLEGLIATVQGG